MLDINARYDDEMSEDEGNEKLKDRLAVIINRMESEASRRVGRMRDIHNRALEDLRQYHGYYDHTTAGNLTKRGKSKLFINMTRPKTDAMSAKLQSTLFPTDDANWSIAPTPVPELTDEAEAAQDALRKLEEKAEAKKKEVELQRAEQEGGVDPELIAEIERLENAAEVVDAELTRMTKITDEARKRAELMAKEIEDQLVECQYQAVCRDQIEDACKIGTGVIKGPVTGDTVRKGWKPQTDEEGNPTNVYALETSSGDTPAFRYVDFWSFFPDPDARTIQESEGVYERHLYNTKKLRNLAKMKGFDKNAIRRLLKNKPTMSAPSYLADLRSISSSGTQQSGELYHVWEYSGCLDAEDMQALALGMGDDELANEYAEIDPLTEINAVIWFCQGEVLKFSVYPYDSGECMYSVFNLFKDEASIFGYGIPWVMRDPQRSLNAAWRAMMDNAAATSGPQIIVAKGIVSPVNGSWNFEGNKFWEYNEGVPQNHKAFDAFNVPSIQAEMGGIIRISMEFIDLMTSMPAIAQGEQGTGVTKTAQGMALLMNSANVVYGRFIKSYDDDVTTPNIRRAYDWNMQFNSKEEIKGDYNVDARGSSTLLVREMQAQNLMILAVQIGAHPKYAHMFKDRDLLKKLLQAHMIHADEILLSDDEIEAVVAKAEAQAAQQQEGRQSGGKDPALAADELEFRREELAAKVEMANMQAYSTIQAAQMNRETAMMKMAETMNMTLDKISADLEKTRMQVESQERKLAGEASMAVRLGQEGAGGGAI